MECRKVRTTASRMVSTRITVLAVAALTTVLRDLRRCTMSSRCRLKKSGEMKGAMFTRDGDRFYVHGDSYLRNYCGFWPDEIHWLNVSAIAGRWWRFLTVHKYWGIDQAIGWQACAIRVFDIGW